MSVLISGKNPKAESNTVKKTNFNVEIREHISNIFFKKNSLKPKIIFSETTKIEVFQENH